MEATASPSAARPGRLFPLAVDMRTMNLSRTRLAFSATLVVAALALTGCQQSTHSPADTGATTKTASPAASPSVAASLPAAAIPHGAASAAGSDLKYIHSPGIVATDEQLAAGQCSAKVVDAASGDYLPDPVCTPGAADPAVTQDNIDSTICTSGYTATVRPPPRIPTRSRPRACVNMAKAR